MNSTKYTFDYYFQEKGDDRVANWPFMKDPTYIFSLTATYLSLVYFVLPTYMKNRKPYNLKTIIQCYNIFQIVSCATLIYKIATSGWTALEISLGCEPIDYSYTPNAMSQLACCWWTCVLKQIELVETVFFSLRKKENQISKLHVYHHTSMIIVTWVGAKYYGGSMTTFPIMVNAFVHVLMYTYYFLSALGPQIQSKIAFIKPKLTMLQMIQFTIVLIHAMQILKSDCNIPLGAFAIFVPNVVVIFSFFINFYVKRYNTKRSKMS